MSATEEALPPAEFKHQPAVNSMRALFVHGLGRSPLSGWPLLWQLKRGGMTTHTFGYLAALESFARIRQRLTSRIARLATQGDYVLIGHSLGGVLLRAALAALPTGVRKPRHIFLLASPVKPSRLAQKFGANPVFRAITGDCGQLLGSGRRMRAIAATAIPTTAIVGVRGLPFMTWPFADEVNDGIVSLSEVSAEWLKDQVPVVATHSLLPYSRQVGEIILDKISPGHPARASGASGGEKDVNDRSLRAMNPDPRPVLSPLVLVSACLLGELVRYDGRSNLCSHPVLQRWQREGRIVPVCPETAGGLPVPRTPVEIAAGAGGWQVLQGQARVLSADGREFTRPFINGAQQALALAQSKHIRVAILKENSPSCGSSFTYDGSFTASRVGQPGVTSALLQDAGIHVFSEHQLENADRLLRQIEAERAGQDLDELDA
jgi:uncharacterized protein YbbK (DUF523 family)